MTAIAPHTSLATSVQHEVDQAVSHVLGQMMTARAHQNQPFAALTPLHWTAITNNLGQVQAVVGRTTDATAPTAVATALTMWASVLDLAESDDGHPGTQNYIGYVEDQPVRLWGVVDRRRFEDHNAEAFAAILDGLTEVNGDHR